jgi:hypothetical protein
MSCISCLSMLIILNNLSLMLLYYLHGWTG